jgi:hypothetical protein
MFKQPSHYFLSISFDWEDILQILEVSESERSSFVVSDKFKYQSPNANSTDGLGINNVSALFEYYIMPRVLRNREYSSAAIYDQQLKRFFESPNINYGPVLENTKDGSSLVCFFKNGMPSQSSAFGNAGFAICFTHDNKWKTILITFDSKFLALTDAHVKWGEMIPFDIYEIFYDGNGDKTIKKISVDPEKIWVNTSVQSQDDAQTGPFDHDLRTFLKK